MGEKNCKSGKKKKIVALCMFVFIGALTTGAVSTTNQTRVEEELVYDGVYLEDKNLGNLTRDELIDVLNEYCYEKLQENTINIVYQDVINEKINASDVGLSYDVKDIADEIINIGKEGNLIKNTLDRIYIKINKKVISFDEVCNDKILDEYIDNLSSLIDIEKEDARVSFNGDEMLISNSREGLIVEKEELKRLIIENLNNETFDEIVEVPVNVVEVEIDEDVFNNMNVLGTYETTLPDLTSGRTQNIRLFSSKLNEVVLMPGEVLSVDEQGGSREISDGYTEAPGFINNEVVPIVAGGICQVVTTLYNSVLYSDLEIVERAPHSLPVSYVSLGRDATLAKGVVDFKFKNNYSNPIVVQAYVTDNCTIKTTIWGINENPEKSIEINAVKTGNKSSITYKNTYESGVLIKSEVLSKDVYN